MHMETKKKQTNLSTYTDKADFKIKPVIKDKDRHYIMIKSQQEDKTFINIHVPDTEAAKYKKGRVL